MAIRTIKTILKQEHLNHINGVEPSEEEEEREAYARGFIEKILIPLFYKVFDKDRGRGLLQITFFEGPNGRTYLTCSTLYLKPIDVGNKMNIIRDAVKYAEEYDIEVREDGEYLDFELNLDD